MNLQESGEMYLETIYLLCKEKSAIRSIDIVEYMNFSKPSVSRAVGLLRRGGYISVADDGYITLTDKGASVAEKMYERHKILSEYLISLGVPERIATADACKMEHVISDESFEAIKKIGK